MLPLSLSYDHRAIDGADAVRFLRWMVEAFEQPFVLEL
jgi:pyruvate dehydrogenase E2 component (dihydrolipoamide acetyltransferase)